MKILPAIGLLGGLTLLTACAKSSDLQTTVLGTTAIYSPSTGEIPLPNDLLFSGSTDATLNPPPSSDPAQQGVLDAISALDGWGTVAAFQVPFFNEDVALMTTPPPLLDPATILPGTNVRLFEVTLDTGVSAVGGPVDGVVRELTGTVPDPASLPDIVPLDPMAEYMAVATPAPDPLAMPPVQGLTAVGIVPLVPFAASSSFMLNLTNGILDVNGKGVTRSIVYQLAAQTQLVAPEDPLAPLQGVVLSMHAAAMSQGIDPNDIVISVQFSTQSIGDVMGTAASVIGGDEATVIAGLQMNPALVVDDPTPDPNAMVSAAVNPVSIGDTGSLAGSFANQADVYVGSVTLPYFSTGAVPGGPDATDVTSDVGPITVPWGARYGFGAGDTERNLTRFNPLPAITEQQTVPLLVTVPKGPKPVSGEWPVVVFQHGITQDRTNLFGIADALAIGGFAAVAIDLPLHGLDSTSPLFAGYLNEGDPRERTFGLDLVNNATQVPVPDGLADPSGLHFINLTALRLSRDNSRQAASDILSLLSVVDEIDVDGDMTPDFDGADVHFVGHSLGGIVGGVAMPFADALQPVNTVTLGMAGGGLAKLLTGSPNLGPVIDAGLAANGLFPGTEEYEEFLVAAQTVADSGDPINYAASLAATGTPIHLIEVVGLLGFNDPDQTVPNSVPGAPLSGTEPLIRALGLASITENTTGDAMNPIQGAVRFTEGDHASLLLPDASIPAFTEMQSQTVEFAMTDGTMLNIGDPSVVEGAE